MTEHKKEENKEKQDRKCFIITPIGDVASETFRMAKGVIESVIKPLLQEHGYNDVKPAYEINETGMINTQIINRIVDDDLVVVNLTGNNPNVMYELCLRHVTAKPIIHICQSGTALPFDIKDNRTIFYKNDMLGVKELREQMEMFLEEIDYSKEFRDNPIYSARKMERLLKAVPEGSGNKIEIELLQSILDKIDGLDMPSKQIQNITNTIYESPDQFTFSFYILVETDIETKECIEKIRKELDEKMLEMGFNCVKETGPLFYYKGEKKVLRSMIIIFLNQVEEEYAVHLSVFFEDGFL